MSSFLFLFEKLHPEIRKARTWWRVLKWYWLLPEARYWAVHSLLQGSYAASLQRCPPWRQGLWKEAVVRAGLTHTGRSELSLRQIGTRSLGYRAGSEWTDDPTTDQDPLLRLEETGREDSSRLYSATFPHDGEPVRMKPIGGSRAGYGQKLGSGASSGAPAWSCAPGLSLKTSVAWLCCHVATERVLNDKNTFLLQKIHIPHQQLYNQKFLFTASQTPGPPRGGSLLPARCVSLQIVPTHCDTEM